MPVLDHCASCGGGGLAVGFSAARGGLVCGDCLARAWRSRPSARGAARRRRAPLADLRARPPSPGVDEALRHLRLLYAYHAGARLRALAFARL